MLFVGRLLFGDLAHGVRCLLVGRYLLFAVCCQLVVVSCLLCDVCLYAICC